MSNGVQARGTVKWFNSEKGYGFIKPADGGPDIFVHKKHLTGAGIKRELVENEDVLFSAIKSEKGLQVETIRLTEGSKA